MRIVDSGVCYRCLQTMEDNLCDLFSCNCGGVLSQDCYDPDHGPQFNSFSTEQLKELLPQVSDSNQTNILLLGKSGVGKTPWINALRNYLEYPTLQDAIDGGMEVLIPSKFEHSGSTIRVGEEDPQEWSTVSGATGHSSTQACRSHYFMMGARRIHIIDTPGIGDTRGINHDKENMDHILTCIGREDQLHGICILLKPDQCRLSEEFILCLTSLLRTLHKNACSNIMFCYTHSRSTFFERGSTESLVRSTIGDIKKSDNRDIPFSDKSTFFFDSEPFKILACIQSKRKFSEERMLVHSESWDNSQEECVRLLETILEVDPHVIAETVSMNDAGKLITLISRPLEEITSNIRSNADKRKRQREKIEKSEDEGARLEACLHRNVEALRKIPLQQPRTVCFAVSCANMVNSDIKYRTCHERCSQSCFNGVLDSGGSGMRFCSVMDWITGYCKACHCHYGSHRQITYDSRREQETITDASVEEQIKENKTTMEIAQFSIDALEKEITELEEEKKKIICARAFIAVFVEENALFPVQHSNIGQRRMDSHSDDVEVQKQTLMAYQKDNELYEEKLAEYSSRAQSSGGIRWEDVREMIAELEKLPLYGNKLRELMEESKKCTPQQAAYVTESTQSIPTLVKNGMAFVRDQLLRKLRTAIFRELLV